jgi:RimJ/RimL family protein N-acetyltransferase
MAPTLTTDRLTLRPYALSDLALAHAVFDSDREVWKFDPGRALSLAERKQALERRIRGYDSPVFGALAITLRESDELIGYCGLQLYLWSGRL